MNNGSTTHSFPSDARIAHSADAIAAEVGGEVVLLNTATGYFHQLNPVASYVWRCLARPLTMAEICARAVEDFEADEDECRRDIGVLVHELHGRGLIRIDA